MSCAKPPAPSLVKELQEAHQTLKAALSDAPAEGYAPNYQAAGLAVLGMAALARKNTE
jgi:hypothetical protein